MSADVGVGVGGKWVMCGCNKHGVGAARACVGGGGVWGFEHRRTPTCTCQPACLSACLSVCQSVSISGLVPQTVILSTMATTVQSCPSGLSTREPRIPGARPSSITGFFSRSAAEF